MEKKVLSVCLLVGVLGIISAVLGFVAEGHRIKESEGGCNNPSGPSAGLGYGAAVALVLARFILSVAGGWQGCCGCCRRKSNKGVTISCGARLCLILSWLASVIALVLLLFGAAIHNYNRHVGEISNDGTIYRCKYVSPGIFAGGAVMALASVILGTISYLILSKK